MSTGTICLTCRRYISGVARCVCPKPVPSDDGKTPNRITTHDVLIELGPDEDPPEGSISITAVDDPFGRWLDPKTGQQYATPYTIDTTRIGRPGRANPTRKP